MDQAHPTAPAHQFRTYASDLAKMSGKSGAKDTKPVPKHDPAPVPLKPKPASTHPAAAPVQKPVPPPTPVPQVPPPAPQPAYEPPPADIIPKAPTTDESREQVLARLRARVGTPEPKAPEPTPATIIPKAPSTDEKREEVLARLKAKAGDVPQRPPQAPPAPRVIPQAPAPVADPSPIHTYKSDFSEKAKREQASPITVLAAEQNAAVRAPVVTEHPEGKKAKLLLVAGSILLILAGGASIFFAYSFVSGRPIAPLAPFVPSLVFGDDYAELSGTSPELRDSLATLGANLGESQVVIAYVSVASTTPKGTVTTVPAEGGALIEALGLAAPSILLRNVESESTVGAIRAGGESRPFFILRVTSYERSFAGMLSWESTIARDLLMFYPPYPSEEGMATSTPAARRTTFRDEIIDNHDARVLRDVNGKAIVLYGYSDKQTLVIARDEAAFTELLSRLAASGSR